jgi:hypothetical protein
MTTAVKLNHKNLLFVNLFLLGLVTEALSAEFVVTDHTFTFTEFEHGFHYFDADNGALGDWTSPDDYYNGSWEVRYEILDYPTSNSMQLQTCIWADVEGSWVSWKEMCAGFKACQGTGVFTHSSTPSEWWKLDGIPVDWSRSADFHRIGMVLRKGDGCIISDWGDWCWNERADYLPMEAHLTIVAVSSGSTFSGWDNYIAGTPVEGCMDTNYMEYNSAATVQPESACETLIVKGCTDSDYEEYNPDANISDLQACKTLGIERPVNSMFNNVEIKRTQSGDLVVISNIKGLYELKIITIKGREILVYSGFDQGEHRLPASRFCDGVYYIMINADGQVYTKRIAFYAPF